MFLVRLESAPALDETFSLKQLLGLGGFKWWPVQDMLLRGVLVNDLRDLGKELRLYLTA